MPVIEEKKGFFGRLSERIAGVISGYTEIDESLYDELEEVLITSDIGMDTTMRIMADLRDHIKFNRIKDPQRVKDSLVNVITLLIDKGDRIKLCDKTPLVILMIGINGGGKTTSIAKLAHMLRKQGKTVMLAAADTFRAAAGEQLEIWGNRIGVSTVRHQDGSDPAAVIFDAIHSAKARGTDVLICDTAGRLQTKKNLMDELAKMNKVIGREFPEAARETLLVLDATTGKNAISQAKEFNDAAEITGLIITKLDGTAKGGIAVTVTDEFNIPIKFIGVGEKLDDLKPFRPREFAGDIFGE
ncbi:MAG: signal recognition particle-docking protein FtsY [Firmicutes bacterium]|nr:signal recognition particle-docking protein FtsY [Bacillota bacterium]